VPHLLNPPPPQYAGELHVPHWRSPPQPSLVGPQVYPSPWQVAGTHDEIGLVPHLSNPPPPQNAGAVHAPQLS